MGRGQRVRKSVVLIAALVGALQVATKDETRSGIFLPSLLWCFDFSDIKKCIGRSVESMKKTHG